MKDRYLLIVEDDADLRDMVIFALKDSGLNVIGAPDAAQAWAMIGDRLPDLILLDWMLPGVSGIDFLRRLRRNEVYRAAPVIMLTAKSDENDRVRGLEAGADDYLIKPFSVKELRARINAVMRRVDGMVRTVRGAGYCFSKGR